FFLRVLGALGMRSAKQGRILRGKICSGTFLRENHWINRFKILVEQTFLSVQLYGHPDQTRTARPTDR
ncbi:MAG: hypothetical protein KAQ78_07480, partial [Candidatus Latescibacteria bacterium]|nr:hypothetical protein [Candidatus Latescibacterota bacterium]